MARLWEASDGFVKIHEGCGGVVRWVEALGDPHTGYTGDCLSCTEDSIPVERIIPLDASGDVDYRDAIKTASIVELRELSWDEDDSFDENQDRLRRSVILGEEVCNDGR